MTLFGFLLFRFGDMERGVAGVRNQGARSWIFGFRRKRLTAVPHADHFFFGAFSRARSSRAREQNHASKSSTHHGLPEPSHSTFLRYGDRFIKKRKGASRPGPSALRARPRRRRGRRRS